MMKLKKILTIYNVFTPVCLLFLALANTVGITLFKETIKNAFFLNWYLVLVMCLTTFSFAYTIFFRQENQELAEFINSLYKKYQFVLLLYFLFILYFIYLVYPSSVNTLVIQLCFTNFILFLMIYALVLLNHKELTGEHLIRLCIMLGIALRLMYTLYNPYDFRQHDVVYSWGHLDYIRYIAEHKSLPQTAEGLTYHPPVHHILSAMIYATGKFLQFSEHDIFRFIQFFMVVLSSYTLIFFYKILIELKCNLITRGVAIALFAFYPSNIYLASWINNDNTLFFFYVISFYWLIKWKNKPVLSHIIILAIFVALTNLTKKVGVFLIPITLATICFEGFKKWQAQKNQLRGTKVRFKLIKNFPYFNHLILFLLIVIPLAFSFQLRQYFFFKQDLFYIPIPSLKVIPSTWFNFFHFPINELFSHPFPNDPLSGNNDYFLYYLFQTSLFGEWQYTGLEISASLLVITSLLNLVFLFIYFAIPQTGRYWDDGYIFMLNLLIFFLAIFKFRLDCPFVCTQNFRYITPLLISTAYFTGRAVDVVASKNKLIARVIVWPLLILQNIFAILFINLIGMPH
jgi:hypothetical protein